MFEKFRVCSVIKYSGKNVVDFTNQRGRICIRDVSKHLYPVGKPLPHRRVGLLHAQNFRYFWLPKHSFYCSKAFLMTETFNSEKTSVFECKSQVQL